MIVRNGKAGAGWRLDEVSEDMATGMEMLMNPFAIVPKEENAERIVNAFAQRDELLKALEIIAGLGPVDPATAAAKIGIDAVAVAVVALNKLRVPK